MKYWSWILGGVLVGLLWLKSKNKKASLPVEKVELLKYADVTHYVSQNRVTEDVAKAGLLRKRNKETEWAGTFIFFYLDKNEKMIFDAKGRALGKVVKAHFIDEELSEAFGVNDVIIFS